MTNLLERAISTGDGTRAVKIVQDVLGIESDEVANYCFPKTWPLAENGSAISGVTEPRRFPSPWSADDNGACFIVKDHNGQALAYVYYEEDPGRRAAANLLTRKRHEGSPSTLPICRSCFSGRVLALRKRGPDGDPLSLKGVADDLGARLVGPGKPQHRDQLWVIAGESAP